MMLPTPKRFSLCVGAGDGASKLNAFDTALLAAGMGNVNLLRVSSILPPGAEHVENFEAPPGTIVPTAYGFITGEEAGETVAAAVGVGRSQDSFGVIMEYSGRCSRQEAEEVVADMVRSAFCTRNLELIQLMVKGVDHTVKNSGCAFAGVALWY